MAIKIEIKSDLNFDESMYDAAFGLAKSLIICGRRLHAVCRRNGFILTATVKPLKPYVSVTIHADT